MTKRILTGNESAAWGARLARAQVVAAYPITPQSPVVETLSSWVESGEMPAEFIAVESEHSAMSVCIGASTAGARAFTATSSNGLAYMTEQIWWAAGARLPIVMCVANRSLAAPWNVLNDQQDSMSVRDAGWVQLHCRDNQEILDTVVQAYWVAERTNLPVMVCYDGFLLSHTAMPVDVPDAAAVDAFLPPRPAPLQVIAPDDPRNIGPVVIADPRRDADGVLRGGYMELRAAHHEALLAAADVVQEAAEAWGRAIGRRTGGLLVEHRLEDAEIVLVAAGSLVTQLTLVADTLRSDGVAAGVLGIRCYRPFPAEAVRERLSDARAALVFDKALSYGYAGPIATDLKAALHGAAGSPAVYGAVCGLGGRDVTPEALADEVRRALIDARAGVVDRATAWVGRLQEGVR
ncbi:pyruvate ferredoxin oxidoreductase [Coriobacteriia bacterium Es71-Z0120]|uniref:transketolase C-terminal domain-containing protein n=1 Tax=Parvivirga hydrogeniphila TaxID=2939460 RepID=UPI0022609D5B|nr:transketolase C-terminal domain-containing protein [Parvivirga hydrogeniphila]MCL4079529.1 pyruvate ferredoxin oxidoreductase [Parvivirga hydrogeniphila]